MTNHFLIRVAVALCGVLAMSQLSAQSLRATFTPLANFAYQLDCVAGVARFCAGAEDFRALWKKEFGVDALSSPHVQKWAQLRKEFGGLVQSTGSSDSPLPASHLDLNKRVLIAAFAARDEADYRSRLALLLPDEMSTQADVIVHALYPAFLKWWQASGDVNGKAMADALIASVDTPTIQTHVSEITKIFGAPSAAQPLSTVHLMYRPGLVETRATSGESLGRESIAEFLGTGDPAWTTPVMLHEYAHFVFKSSDIARATTLRDAVVSAGGDVGLPIWALFNEALATALGNGRVYRSLVSKEVFDQYTAKPHTFYSAPDIDAAAKAILPLVDTTVAAGGTVFDDAFINGYVDAVRTKLGDTLAKPATFMRNYTLIVDSALGSGPEGGAPWAKQFVSVGRSMYVSSCCEGNFAQAVQKNVGKAMTIIAVTPAHFPLLLKMLDLPTSRVNTLNDILKNSATRAAVLIKRDGATPPLVVVVAHDAVAFERAAEAVAAMPALRATIVSIP